MFAFALFYNVIECRAQIRDFRYIYILLVSYSIVERGRRGRDRMVVGFTTTCTISAYHD
jgi:hypothetical protein